MEDDRDAQIDLAFYENMDWLREVSDVKRLLSQQNAIKACAYNFASLRHEIRYLISELPNHVNLSEEGPVTHRIGLIKELLDGLEKQVAEDAKRTDEDLLFWLMP